MSRREDFNDGYEKGIADLLPALKACEGALSSYVDGNTSPDLRACAAIRDMAQSAIADAGRNLQATGNDELQANHDALKQAFTEADGHTREVWVELEELDVLPIEQAIAEAVQRDEADRITTGTHNPNHSAAVIPGVVIQDNRGPIHPTPRTYQVQMRRPIYQFATEYVEAKDARAAVENILKVANDPIHFNRWDWQADDAQDVDWVHAELGEGEQGFPDYWDWEEPKLSPGVLVEALNRIMVLSRTPLNEVAMGSALNTIIEIAATALHKAIPSDE